MLELSACINILYHLFSLQAKPHIKVCGCNCILPNHVKVIHIANDESLPAESASI